MNRCLVVLLFLGAAWTAPARLALVATGGRIYQGHVRLADQHLIVVNAEQDLHLHIAPSNLTWAFFETAGAQTSTGALVSSLEPWQEADIGSVPIRGDTRRTADTFTVRSSGLGIQGISDSFHFVYQPGQSNCEIVTRIAMTHLTHPSARCGVMLRDTLAPDARCVMLGTTPGRGGFFLFRDQDFAHPTVLSQPDITAPCWVKLKREGREFTAYKSRNGRQWTQAGSVSVQMHDSIFAGLATTSARESVVNWTTFDKPRVGAVLSNSEFPPRAELVSGSIVAGWPVTVGDELDFRWNFSSVTVPTHLVARLMFQWASPDWLAIARHQSTGVWLANGDFFEGDLRAVEAGRLRISSVLYGMKNFDSNNDVVMVALQRDNPHATRFEVRTVNGCVWRSQSLLFADNELILEEPVLGAIKIPVHQLAAIFQRR